MRSRLNSFETNYHSELYTLQRKLRQTQNEINTWRACAILSWALLALTLGLLVTRVVMV